LYYISQSTLNGFLKRRTDFANGTETGSRKRKREGKSQVTDKALLVWYKQAFARNCPIDRGIFMAKANSLAEE